MPPATKTRTCRVCGETKALAEFDKRGDVSQYHRVCKACRRDYQRQRLLRTPLPVSRSKRVFGTGETFLCTRCGRSLPGEAFPRKAKGSLFLQSWCRDCFSAFNWANYAANRPREIARIRANELRNREQNRIRVREYLASHHCVDCGEDDPDVLEFDHLHDKRYDVSNMVQRGMSWSLIETEIAKCEVRCANDHRRKTRQRRLAAG